MKDITLVPFVKNECDVMELKKDYTLSYTIPFTLTQVTLRLKIIHFHALFLGLFASLLAPLGGLFASGFKRAIKIKDFANTIPGHGGLTDRMDCQILMVIEKFYKFFRVSLLIFGPINSFLIMSKER